MYRRNPIYYVVFPAVVFFLCCFSFYLGWMRGQQMVEMSRMKENSEEIKETDLRQPELSYFKVLRSDQSRSTISSSMLPVTTDKKSFSIQLSAVKDLGKARELAAKLKSQGYNAQVRSNEGGDSWHRVFIVGFDNRDVAMKILKKIVDKKYGTGFIVEE